jgi:PEP-CTERM motif
LRKTLGSAVFASYLLNVTHLVPSAKLAVAIATTEATIAKQTLRRTMTTYHTPIELFPEKSTCSLIILGICILLAVAGNASAQIVLGQVDDFQAGTVMGWQEGGVSPNPPTNVANGGPGGAGDRFLQNISAGGSGAGSRMIMFNLAQWTGNYTAAGVNRITAQMANLGTKALHMRIAVRGGPGQTEFGSIGDQVLDVDGGIWHNVSFDLTNTALANISGPDSLAATLASITELRILSAAAGPAFDGDSVAATLGADNIMSVAVPEPSSLFLFGTAAFSALVGSTRKRMRRTEPKIPILTDGLHNG